MKVYTVGEDRIEAASAASLVKRMSELSFAPSESTAAWMEDAAERYRQMGNMEVRTDTADHFVADLIKAGMIKEGGGE